MTTSNRISWDQYFMSQSHLLSQRSTCTRLAVGATIVRDKRIIAGGYNGSISGGTHCIDEGCYVIDEHCVRTIHAEVNALLQCAKFGVPTEGAEIYVTHFPCIHCTKALIQSGIKALHYAKDYKNHPYAEEMLQQAGVFVQKVEVAPVDAVTDLNEEHKHSLTGKLLEKLAEKGMPEAELAALRQEAEKLYKK
ncbi:ComE operon protein 2 [Bacillus marinisedimentorum]|uniref:ComE operon protein 2 n=1 Tax=Bacillus marinisedimentorum TaxID=1821260 RepID=UPI000872F50C|nr:ComE operon protein 2 [Bacillus marinisedimentorum]